MWQTSVQCDDHGCIRGNKQAHIDEDNDGAEDEDHNDEESLFSCSCSICNKLFHYALFLYVTLYEFYADIIITFPIIIIFFFLPTNLHSFHLQLPIIINGNVLLCLTSIGGCNGIMQDANSAIEERSYRIYHTSCTKFR